MGLPAIQKHPPRTPVADNSNAGRPQESQMATIAAGNSCTPGESGCCDGSSSSSSRMHGRSSSISRHVQLYDPQGLASHHKRQRQSSPPLPAEGAAALVSGEAPGGGLSNDADADMPDADQQMMQQIARLRQDEEYVDALNKAVDMDWSVDGQQLPYSSHNQQQQQQQRSPWDIPATALAGHSSNSDSCNIWLDSLSMMARQLQAHPLLMLTVVVDTNVLLHGQGILLLQQLQEVYHRQHLPGRQQQTLPTEEQHWPQVQIFIPWAVLLELDRLKSSGCSPLHCKAQQAWQCGYIYCAQLPCHCRPCNVPFCFVGSSPHAPGAGATIPVLHKHRPPSAEQYSSTAHTSHHHFLDQEYPLLCVTVTARMYGGGGGEAGGCWC